MVQHSNSMGSMESPLTTPRGNRSLDTCDASSGIFVFGTIGMEKLGKDRFSNGFKITAIAFRSCLSIVIMLS